MRTASLILIVFLSPLLCFNQMETANWYFGGRAGITFNTSDKEPVAVTNSGMYSLEGCSSISDSVGNLLFYTNGETVYSKDHSVMTNGTGLYGSSLSTQSSLIVRMPGSKNIYYIFTTDAREGSGHGLCYSIVDISRNNGLGEVIKANINLLSTSTEKLTAAAHKNESDIWIISHEWNSNRFFVYLLTPAGLSDNPVVSSTGSQHYGDPWNSMGYMKASPDGSKIALGIFSDRIFELFNFDNNSGMVSNPISLYSDTYYGASSMEFSPDGSKLYLSVDNWLGLSRLYQVDLSKYDKASIEKSRTELATFPRRVGALQLGLNGKIYHALYESEYLGVISDPNAPGKECNYKEHGVFLKDRHCYWGLPNFMQTYYQTDCSKRDSIRLWSVDSTFVIGSSVAIPFYARFNDVIKGQAYKMKISFDARAFYPEDYTNTTILADTIKNGIRTLTIAGFLDLLQDSTLFTINGRILLGDTNRSEIKITDFDKGMNCITSAFINVSSCVFNLRKINSFENRLNIYPNPTGGKETIIELNDEYKGAVTIDIFTLQGVKLVSFYFKKYNKQLKENLDLESWPAGVYTAVVTTGGSRLTKPIVIIK